MRPASHDAAFLLDMLTIRCARAGDVPAITAIYNDAILKTVASFDTEPKSLGEQIAWLGVSYWLQ